MNNKRLNIIVSVCILAWSLTFVFTGWSYPVWEQPGIPGPGFFPRWVCLALAILSFAYFIQSVKSKEDNGNVFPGKKEMMEIGTYLLSVIVFIVLCKPLGFSIAMVIMMLIMFLYAAKWPVALGMSCATTLVM